MKRTPLRPKGAVLINPRPKRGGSKSAQLAALFGKRRKNPARRRRRASLGAVIVNPRRRRAAPKRRAARRNPARRRTAVRRRNPVRRRRALRRNPRRKDRRRLASGSIIRTKRNPRRRYAGRRRNPGRRYARRRNGMRKIPVVGGILGTLYSLVPTTIAGALSVEPTLAVAQLLARYFPGMSTTGLYPVSGFVVAIAAKKLLPKLGVSASLADTIAVATASAGGAVGYYKWRTGQNTDAATEMGALVMSGLGSPVAGLIMGDAGLGELVTMAGYNGYGNVAYATHQQANPLATGMAY